MQYTASPAQWQCYLLHFERKVGNPDSPRGQAGHYLGLTGCLQARVAAHEQGYSAKLLHAVHQAGIRFQVVRTWEAVSYTDGRSLERKLKSLHDSPSLCPICRRIRSGGHPTFRTQQPRPRQPMKGVFHDLDRILVGDYVTPSRRVGELVVLGQSI